ncbi:hypothetical protein EHQ12_07530 [Leptospira gomenensis]|uniref:Uncharacterized protein n=1 Tax=Leptospira gomenensis TaxID=2484974 RepID=A0A5F1YCH2_9LEPT|nr:hypothetical protein [Leptospira gomenensis]TGK35447.1 hypothetical protein EHQ17_05785 [Leptospira gomenensis]TGK40661.1 hypothetical protein EHQ12_07530 [Leptospira gomenensis]TGK46339.1 hypothetical protein EHQ07_06700 [Leptospira gomenensis]TGK66474.1 hypothetical protein EHQ13_03105 [Leptospira gomenensis]
MIRILLIASICLPLVLESYPKRDARGSVSENYLRQQGIITLDLKKIHFRENDRIPVRLSITNTGHEAVRIFPSGRDLESYRIVVRDEDGLQVPERDDEKRIDPVLKRRNTIESLEGKEVKEIILHKDEVFSKEIDLGSRFDLIPGKKYFVTAYFHPNVQEMPSLFVRSKNQPYFFFEQKHNESVSTSVPEKDPAVDGLEPEEVIHLFLGSEKKRNWTNHFKWIYFPEYVQAYDQYSEEYNRAEESERDFLLENFKRYLTESRAGLLQSYRILNTEHSSPGLAKVTVFVERKLNRLRSKYEYTYTLRRVPDEQGGFWKVSNLVAKVKK